MEIIVLGCSGSVAGPDAPASGYFLRDEQQESVLLDIGPGVLAQMQRTEGVEPSECHVVFSHMHADHCLDFPSLLVWRRFHPTSAATRTHTLLGPAIAQEHLAHASGDYPDDPDDFSDTFEVRVHEAGSGDFDANSWPHHKIGNFQVFAAPALHPTEAYLTRIHDAEGRSLVYSGDTADAEALGKFAKGAEVLLCEAAWGASSAGKPEGMHLSGDLAGRAAALAGVKKLVLTHIPPWVDKDQTLQAAQREFAGEIVLAHPGMVLNF
ncbi:MBL fold metallo-hydrolase [Corynebacterium suicordis]|uniref:MBL fold metallo-hydrolase n=1 Tax=uncultured Corynebacterium sp. TaxID=159447 RepID=UPI0025986EB9|nr:MBL fold metallo-hydrolase [uncultured Corynebacterium sp.]